MPYLIIAGIGAAAWLTKETGDLVDSSASLARVLVAGGVVYVGYRVLVK